jgi:dTMP kinase
VPFIKNIPLYVAVDGIDGCGKSTQVNKLCKELGKYKLPFVQTKEPGGTETGKVLRKILISNQYYVEPETELLLYCADRLEHQKKLIIPSLKNNVNVICDRSLASTYAYQIFGRGLNESILKVLIPISVFKWPDITFIIDTQPEVALNRALKRLRRKGEMEAEGKFENLGIDFLKSVRDGFLWYAQNYDNVVVIDGNCSAEEVFLQIKNYIFGD